MIRNDDFVLILNLSALTPGLIHFFFDPVHVLYSPLLIL
jgi:hypothetical protein